MEGITSLEKSKEMEEKQGERNFGYGLSNPIKFTISRI
jgi:hypothetical protein